MCLCNGRNHLNSLDHTIKVEKFPPLKKKKKAEKELRRQVEGALNAKLLISRGRILVSVPGIECMSKQPQLLLGPPRLPAPILLMMLFKQNNIPLISQGRSRLFSLFHSPM